MRLRFGRSPFVRTIDTPWVPRRRLGEVPDEAMHALVLAVEALTA